MGGDSCSKILLTTPEKKTRIVRVWGGGDHLFFFGGGSFITAVTVRGGDRGGSYPLLFGAETVLEPFRNHSGTAPVSFRHHFAIVGSLPKPS